jgi:hypothetical protein
MQALQTPVAIEDLTDSEGIIAMLPNRRIPSGRWTDNRRGPAVRQRPLRRLPPGQRVQSANGPPLFWENAAK